MLSILSKSKRESSAVTHGHLWAPITFNQTTDPHIREIRGELSAFLMTEAAEELRSDLAGAVQEVSSAALTAEVAARLAEQPDVVAANARALEMAGRAKKAAEDLAAAEHLHHAAEDRLRSALADGDPPPEVDAEIDAAALTVARYRVRVAELQSLAHKTAETAGKVVDGARARVIAEMIREHVTARNAATLPIAKAFAANVVAATRAGAALGILDQMARSPK